jgi:hypothetical protein
MPRPASQNLVIRRPPGVRSLVSSAYRRERSGPARDRLSARLQPRASFRGTLLPCPPRQYGTAPARAALTMARATPSLLRPRGPEMAASRPRSASASAATAASLIRSSMSRPSRRPIGVNPTPVIQPNAPPSIPDLPPKPRRAASFAGFRQAAFVVCGCRPGPRVCLDHVTSKKSVIAGDVVSAIWRGEWQGALRSAIA